MGWYGAASCTLGHWVPPLTDPTHSLISREQNVWAVEAHYFWCRRLPKPRTCGRPKSGYSRKARKQRGRKLVSIRSLRRQFGGWAGHSRSNIQSCGEDSLTLRREGTRRFLQSALPWRCVCPTAKIKSLFQKICA